MSLNNDALETIQKTAVEASRGKIIELPGNRQTVGHQPFIDPTGDLKFVPIPVQPRRHQASTYSSLVAYANNLAEPKKAVVWLHETNVVLIIDDSKRDELVTLCLHTTPQFNTLRDTADDPRNQRDFIRLLRIDLAGTHDNSGILSEVRSLTFTGKSEGKGVVQAGRESMGRSIEAEVVSATKLPEEVVLDVRVYDLPDFAYTHAVRCALDVILQDEKFRLVALPMELNNAANAALTDLGDRIRFDLNKDIPLYRGYP